MERREDWAAKASSDWHWFDHPQLGRVEIGGWDHKYVWQNAPAKYLPEICEKQSAFTIAHALMSPRLEFLKTNVEAARRRRVQDQRRGRQYRLPAHLHQHRAQERKAVRPIEVTLQLPEDATLVSGKALYDAGQLEGRTNKIYGGWFSSRSITDNQKRLEWVVAPPQAALPDITVAERPRRHPERRRALGRQIDQTD